MNNLLRDWPQHSKTGRKTIAFVGMAQTTRHLAPFDDKEILLMGLNEMYHPNIKNQQGETLMQRWDAWIQIHRAWDALREYNFNDENHPYWLTNTSGPCWRCGGQNPKCVDCKGAGIYTPNRSEDFPIYVGDPDLLDKVPGSILYPRDEIVKHFELDEHDDWFTSTLAFQIALALYMEFEEIQVFGYEMSSGTEYSQQKSCTAYWFGRAKSLGVKRVLPDGCGLMGLNDSLYAYENVPGLYTLQHAEIDVNAWKKEVDVKIAKLNSIRGEKKRVLQKLNIKSLNKGTKAKLVQEAQEMTKVEVDALSELNAANGAYQQAQNVQKRLKGHPRLKTLKRFSDMKFKIMDTKTGETVEDPIPIGDELHINLEV